MSFWKGFLEWFCGKQETVTTAQFFEDDEDRFKDGEFRRDAGEKRVKNLF